MRVSIVGPPQSGKTTLMRVLSGERTLSHHGEDHIERVIKKHDRRLEEVSKAYGSSKITFPEIYLEEIVSLRLGKRGVLNQRVRLADYFIGVFTDKSEKDELLSDFLLEDLSVVEKRLDGIEKDKKKGRKGWEDEEKALLWIKDKLEGRDCGDPPKDVELYIKNFQLLFFKPMVSIHNIRDYEEGRWEGDWLVVNLDLEKELLFSEDRNSLMEEFGIRNLLLENFWEEVFKRFHLITFFTANPREARAWIVPEGTSAIEAAGKIHSDIEKGFIRAEVYNFKDFEAFGYNEKALKEKGLIRTEGKDYIVKDGDVIYFRFNV